MERFTLLKNKDMEEVNEFLNNSPDTNSLMIGIIQKHGLESYKNNKKGGHHYGYFFNDNLNGIFSFTNAGSLICYYENADILNKIVLLKTIKEYKPKHIAGPKKHVESLWKRLEKTTKYLRYDECNFMILNKENFSPFYTDNKIINSKDYLFSDSIDFLIEVEKAFGKNPNTINDLKNKVYESYNEGEYLYLLENEKVVAQALIQNTTFKLGEIGGVFTLDQHRGKGYARAIVSQLCKGIIKDNKIPYLIVSKKNERAKEIYSSIGFESLDDYLMIDFELI